MVYPKSLRKDEQNNDTTRSDRAKLMWASRKISKGVAKSIMNPPMRRRSRLFYYIGFIYIPIGFLILLLGFLYLNQATVLGAEVLWGIGYLMLIHLDEKNMEREHENERLHHKNQ